MQSLQVMTFEGINNMDDFANMLVAKHTLYNKKHDDSTLMQSPPRLSQTISPALRTPVSQPIQKSPEPWCDEHDQLPVFKDDPSPQKPLIVHPVALKSEYQAGLTSIKECHES